MTDENDTTLIELASGIVESYVSNNQMQPDQVPDFLGRIHTKLVALQKATNGEGAPALPEPPVKPQNSVRKNDVVCLECGKTFKTLKRHLRSDHGLEEADYKARWGLPKDMKLVAKDYSAKRSQMAQQIGLGSKRASKGKKK